ncbi:MAG: ATPase, T2SS/T4P/T4SS family [Phycisphaerae bacterium]
MSDIDEIQNGAEALDIDGDDSGTEKTSAPKIDKLFRAMEKMGGSDLHFKAGSAAKVRVRGGLKSMSTGPMSDEKIRGLIFDIMTEDQKTKFHANGAMDFAHQAIGGSRFRINVFLQRGLMSMAARRISSEILDYSQLHLPPVLERLAQHHQGLVLVSGITGSGKSTTIAAMMEQINKTRSCHIVTLEDPIEFQYTDKKSFINQLRSGNRRA